MNNHSPMDREPKSPIPLQVFLAVAAGLLLLIVLASALPELQMLPGSDSGLMRLFSNTFARPETTPWADGPTEGPLGLTRFWILVIWGCLTLCIVYAVISPTYRKALLAATATTVLITFVLMRVLENQEPQEPEQMGGGGAPQTDLQFAAEEPLVPPEMEVRDGWVYAVTAVAGLALAGLGLYLVSRYYSGRNETPELIRMEAREAIAALETGHDVGDTIERCYLNMVRCLEDTRRVRRNQSMTPREFEQRLAGLGMHSRPVHRLSQLFERIRFGDRPATERERQEAVDNLKQIRDSQPPAAGSSQPPDLSTPTTADV